MYVGYEVEIAKCGDALIKPLTISIKTQEGLIPSKTNLSSV